VNGLRILLLGPIELWVDERQATLGGPKQRALLAVLALEPGTVVSRDRASEVLWGDAPAESQRLHTVVSRLRTAVRDAGGSPDVIETTDAGYRLLADGAQIDSVRAARELRNAREFRGAGDMRAAARAAAEALARWRGEPLADLNDSGWASADRRRLDDLRLSLQEEEFDARLALGESRTVIEQLEAACASAPLRERLHAQLLLALSAAGRRTDALDQYDRFRRTLSEELGIEPGAAVRAAHQAALDEDVEPPSEPARRRRAGRVRTPFVLGALAVGSLGAAAVLLLRGSGASPAPTPLQARSGTLVLAAPDARHLIREIPLSGEVINEQPDGLLASHGSLWAVTVQGTVTQIDIAQRRVVGTTSISVPTGPGGMALGLGSVWISDSGRPLLYRVIPGTPAAEAIHLPKPPGHPHENALGVAVADGSVWVVRGGGYLDRLNPDGILQRRFRIPGARYLVKDGQSIWVLSSDPGIVTKLDARTGATLARTRLRPRICCAAVGGGSVWVTSENRGLLWQLSPDGVVQDVLHVRAPATELAYSRGAIWVSSYAGGKVTRIDLHTHSRRTISVRGSVVGMAAAPGLVAFASLGNEREALAGIRGPIARIVLSHDLISDHDPATPAVYGNRDADWQAVSATCLSLYDYRGDEVRPYAATGPGVRSANGRAWKFRVRPGFAFSPPSDEPVDAGTFAGAIERSTNPLIASPAAAHELSAVAGMSAYRRGLTRHIAGIEAKGNTLTIRLEHPVRDLEARLAARYFCAIPKHTPAVTNGVMGPLPSAGPYYLAGVSTGSFTVLRRNPHYPGPGGGFAAFVYRFNVDPRRAVAMVRRGKADYAAFYREDDALHDVARAGGDALGIRFRGAKGRGLGELFGHRVSCHSYSPLYAGVELTRLCPTPRASSR
jgi:DNA-binding SARP family transcriptional activator/streptogramin lyase